VKVSNSSKKASRVIGSVNNAEVTFGAGLTGVFAVHMPDVVQGVTAGATPEVAGIGEGGVAGRIKAGGIRGGFPAAEGGPPQLRSVGMGPIHCGDLESPTVGRFRAAKEIG